MIEVIKTYISKKLIDIRDLVKDINLTYVYEKAIDYHTIIVEPTYTYENNPLFHSLEKDLIEEIGKKFGIYDILFTQAGFQFDKITFSNKGGHQYDQSGEFDKTLRQQACRKRCHFPDQ